MIDVYKEGRSVRGRMTRKQNYRTTDGTRTSENKKVSGGQ
jgi:hypothetical protein